MEPVKERVVQHLKLAQIIASKYFNIPGTSREEAISEAQAALVRASAAYDPTKGPFTPFAGTVIRNALNSLFKKQLRNAQMIAKSLDETIHGATQFGTYIGNLGQNIEDTKYSLIKKIKNNEKKHDLEKAIKTLNKAEKALLQQISIGVSLSKIAQENGVSKQAIHKKVQKIFHEIKSRIEI